MQYSELRHTVLIVPHPGANLTVNDAEGVVKAVIGFAGGLHKLGDLIQYFTPGDEFTPADGAVLARRDGTRTKVMGNPHLADTGANLEYQPERMSDGERELRMQMRRLQERVERSEKRKETIQNRKPEPEPELVEPDEPEKSLETEGDADDGSQQAAE